jgi:hypothetical protein
MRLLSVRGKEGQCKQAKTERVGNRIKSRTIKKEFEKPKIRRKNQGLKVHGDNFATRERRSYAGKWKERGKRGERGCLCTRKNKLEINQNLRRSQNA